MYKIAVVEDDTIIRKELQIVLINHEYEVCIIEDFKNVSDQIKEWKPHIVLLDINLPYEDGI